MLKLTSQQEAFAQAVAAGASQADAYRMTYPKSLKWKPESVYSKSAQAAAVAKVQQRVAELREALADKALWSREQAVAAFLAEVQGDRASDRINALKALNEMHGFNAPTKSELLIKGSLTLEVVGVKATG